MELKTYADSGLLHAMTTGRFSSSEAERTFLVMLDAVAKHNANKVLVDGRQLQGELDAFQRFLFGKFAADTVANFLEKRGVPLALQFAYVLREPILDPNRFGQMVAVNRGMWVKAFDNIDDAVEWLELVPASKPDSGESGRNA